MTIKVDVFGFYGKIISHVILCPVIVQSDADVLGRNFFGKNVNGPIFFKTDRLDAAQEEQKNGLFRSPDGWQSMELEEDDNNSFFYHESHSKRLQRHNSWSGSGHSPKIQRDYFQGSARFSSTKGKM